MKTAVVVASQTWICRLLAFSIGMGSLSPSLFMAPSLCLSLSLSLCVSLCLCLSFCLSVSLSLSLCLCLCLSRSPHTRTLARAMSVRPLSAARSHLFSASCLSLVHSCAYSRMALSFRRGLACLCPDRAPIAIGDTCIFSAGDVAAHNSLPFPSHVLSQGLHKGEGLYICVELGSCDAARISFQGQLALVLGRLFIRNQVRLGANVDDVALRQVFPCPHLQCRG